MTQQNNITALAEAIGADIKELQAGPVAVPLTRAQLDVVAAASGIVPSVLYHITDEDRLAVGTSASTYTAFLREDEAVAPVEIVATPANVSPAANALNVAEPVTLTGGSFGSSYAASTHAGTRVQVSATADFSGALLYDSGEKAASAGVLLPADTVAGGALAYWRIAHKSSSGLWSEFSTPTQYTAKIVVYTIPAPTATPAIGAAFEGGYYAGLYWAPIAQSSTSKLLATGTQVFTVPDQAVTPIVYIGHAIEIRSRANPSNKFVGTVTAANGTQLTVNVTSKTGTGTFADWSIMSQFRHITAPTESGILADTNLYYSNLYPATTSVADGLSNTNDWYALDDGTTPFAPLRWVKALNIGGHTDWHIPSRDQLELEWRNLHPNGVNTVQARSATTASSYKKDGTVVDVTTPQGVNKNSVPLGAAYTATVPGITAATAFRTGGAQAHPYDRPYISSTMCAEGLWMQNFYSGYEGLQDVYAVSQTADIRACRRSII